jgi:hypothetical protein
MKLIILLTLSVVCKLEKCGLEDGRYHVQYNLTNEGVHDLTIKGKGYIEFRPSGDMVSGKIIQMSPCVYVMTQNVTDIGVLKVD